MKFAYLIEPPFNDRSAGGDVFGHDVEIARAVCAVLGRSFEPIETEFAQLLPGLNTGQWEMTTGLFATPERQKQAAFCQPIWALPDGLLVRKGNPLNLTGYRAVSRTPTAMLAVIQDQFQHQSALKFGVSDDQLVVFETYRDAAQAVLEGHTDAYASVARAHAGFIAQSPDAPVEVVTVPAAEKPPAFGAFAVSRQAPDLLADVNDVLSSFVGSDKHRALAKPYGFTDADIDLVSQHRGDLYIDT